MARVIILRLLILAIVIYGVYALYYFLERKRDALSRDQKMRELEKTVYDEKEWEKIKKELGEK
jgi:hypothetical protein